MLEISICVGAFLITLVAVYLLNMNVYGRKTSLRLSIALLSIMAALVLAKLFFHVPAFITDWLMVYVAVFYGYTGGVIWARIVQKKRANQS